MLGANAQYFAPIADATSAIWFTDPERGKL